MSGTGFLGTASVEQTPNIVEAPKVIPEQDEYNIAEEQAEKEMVAEDQVDTFLEQAPKTVVQTQPAGQTQPIEQIVQKDEITIEVEKILEAGLGEYVTEMPEEARLRFLKKGGEVAAQLSIMVRSLNMHVSLVVKLLKEWLLTIPGVNKYFIEQEAKIKADMIIDLIDQHRSPS
ncbi:MAG: hypothetical protein WCK01_04700 [Candidatus Uhrbacteria bacterium]